MKVLDGECYEMAGIGFAGVCGFGGGFGQRMLNPWGESLIKSFVQEAVDHAIRLERALARLETPQRVALLHYAPIRETVEGESLELYPFLGSTRLEGPLNRFKVQAAFHGLTILGRRAFAEYGHGGRVGPHPPSEHPQREVHLCGRVVRQASRQDVLILARDEIAQ